MADSGNKENTLASSKIAAPKKRGCMKAEKKPLKQAKLSPENDLVFITLLSNQTTEGKTSDNGWKLFAWTVAMVALKGSEMLSGGAPKSVAACALCWDKVR